MSTLSPQTSYLKTSVTSSNQPSQIFDVIDNIAAYPTPEGLTLTLIPAGLMPRLSAWIIDSLIKILFYTVISFVGVFFGEAGFGFMAIGYFLVSWLYPVFFEVYRQGMTPGKKKQNIYVCHDDGTPITLQASLIRNLLRVADFLPFAYVSAAVVMLFNKKSQRIGDIVAGTIVVYRNEDGLTKLFQRVHGAAEKVNDLNVDDDSNANAGTNVNATAAPLFFYPLTLNEQQALLSFSERLPFLSADRQVEIAMTLAPLLGSDAAQLNAQTVNSHHPISGKLLAIIRARVNAIRGYQSDANQSVHSGGD